MDAQQKKIIASFSDLKSIRDARRIQLDQESARGGIIVKVALATCGIASGAQETYDYFSEELDKRNIEAKVHQTGCMGYCYAEPTVEVSIPGYPPAVFGNVDNEKANLIIEKYIRNKELVDGLILQNYESIEQA